MQTEQSDSVPRCQQNALLIKLRLAAEAEKLSLAEAQEASLVPKHGLKDYFGLLSFR